MRCRIIIFIFIGCILEGCAMGRTNTVCEPIINYDGTKWKIASLNLPKPVDINVAGIEKEKEILQAAAETTQILDNIRVSNCNKLLMVNDYSQEYINLLQQSMYAEVELAKFALIVSRSKASPNEFTPLVLKNMGSPAVMDKASDKLKKTVEEIQINNPAAKVAVQQGTEEFVQRQRFLDELFQKEQAVVARDKMNKILEEIRDTLNIAGKLRSNIFRRMDSHLEIPEGFILNFDTPYWRLVKIPIGYGAAGIAYEKKEAIIAEMPTMEDEIRFKLNDKQSMEEARKLLLPKGVVNPELDWVVSLPLLSGEEVIGVWNIDCVSAERNRCRVPIEGLRRVGKIMSKNTGDLINQLQKK